MNEIFVIVENFTDDKGNERIEIVDNEGYFIDENIIEKRVEQMNKKYVKLFPEDISDTELEELETHYGFIPLTMNHRNRG